MTRLTSRQHPVVKRFRALVAHRDAELVVLDGEHLLGEALDAGIPIDTVLASHANRALAERAAAAGAVAYDVTLPVLEAASPVKSPAGIVAIARWKPQPIDTVFHTTSPLVLALVGVQDPGNVGSAIRSATALGATGIVAVDGTSDPGGWKALRGAMGSTFRLPVAASSLSDVVSAARRHRIRIAATVATGGTSLHDIDLRLPTLFLLGNEGAGLPASVVTDADVRLSVPMEEGTNSLNVAVTAALILWEARRQRQAHTPPSALVPPKPRRGEGGRL